MLGPIRKCWAALRRPSTRWAAGTLVLLGLLGGSIGWVGLETAVHQSNTLEFCLSCHEMEANVFQEYKESKHYRNHSGVRAICSDCHAPKAMLPTLWLKAQKAINEIPRHLLGTLDSKEKFVARRPVLAEKVWAHMKANDSQECRSCHSREAMALAVQKPRARGQHEAALASGETCIDCHKGVVHALPEPEHKVKAEAETETETETEDDFAL